MDGIFSHASNKIKMLLETLAGRVATVELTPMRLSESSRKPLSPFFEIFESKNDRSNLSSLKGLQPRQTCNIHNIR